MINHRAVALAGRGWTSRIAALDGFVANAFNGPLARLGIAGAPSAILIAEGVPSAVLVATGTGSAGPTPEMAEALMVAAGASSSLYLATGGTDAFGAA